MALSLWSEENLFDGADEIVLRNLASIFPSSENCSFIHERVEICTRESWSSLRNNEKVYIFSKRFFVCVDLQNFFTVVSIRKIDGNASVEASRSKKRGIK